MVGCNEGFASIADLTCIRQQISAVATEFNILRSKQFVLKEASVCYANSVCLLVIYYVFSWRIYLQFHVQKRQVSVL